MDFHADDDFPVAGGAFDQFRGFALHVHGADYLSRDGP